MELVLVLVAVTESVVVLVIIVELVLVLVAITASEVVLDIVSESVIVLVVVRHMQHCSSTKLVQKIIL